MKPEQHQAHLRKVATASVSTSTSGDLTHTGGDSLQTNDVSPLSLSLDVSSVSEGITVPLPCLLYIRYLEKSYRLAEHPSCYYFGTWASSKGKNGD